MDCTELREHLDAIALSPHLEALDGSSLEHVKGCVKCQEEMRQYQEAWLLLSAALPQPPVSESLEARVMDGVVNASPEKQRAPNNLIVLKYALAAGVLFLLVGLTFLRLNSFNIGSTKAAELEQIRSIAVQMEKLDELESVFATPQLKYVSLKSANPQTPTAYLVHDPMSQQIHLFGANLKAGNLKSSKLHVWLMDEQDQTLSSSAITFAKNQSHGSALLTLDQPDAVDAVLITVETATEDPSSPSDDVVLLSRDISL